ncbi:MAG TPA: hypothetical protein VF992_07780 [Thermoplasmata archaeon]
MIDIATIQSWILANAAPVGLGLLVGAFVARLFGKALSVVLLAGGFLVTSVLAVMEWQAAHDLGSAAILLLAGFAITAIAAGMSRAFALLLTLVFVGAGTYLLLYRYANPSILTAALGIGAWIASTIVGTAALQWLHTWRQSRMQVEPGYPSAPVQ